MSRRMKFIFFLIDEKCGRILFYWIITANFFKMIEKEIDS